MPMHDSFALFEEKVLRRCQRPARYTGGELGSVRKDWNGSRQRWALLFPDLYELGISNMGISILYAALNGRADTLCERFYMPAPDAFALMAQDGIAPLSLENRRPASAFGVLGISLPYELCVTNVLAFLRLSGIALRACDRNDGPIVIGGGSMACNPLPLEPFFDAFFVGEGEQAVGEMADAIDGAGGDRRRAIEALAKIDGVYVPSVHDRRTARITRRIVQSLDDERVPMPLVPLVEPTFNRLSIEAARGCTRGCRFCLSGMTCRPYRERGIDSVVDAFSSLLPRTGFDEFSPSSLSMSDYSRFPELFGRLHALSNAGRAALSLPSLRVGSIDESMAEKIRSFRKTGFTVAPETYPAFQACLNKNVDFGLLEQDIVTALSLGWSSIKLYFMLGLPGEDVAGFSEIRDFVKGVQRRIDMKRASVTLSFSTFVPKPHTPLQWAAMDGLDEIRDKQRILKDLFFRERRMFLKLHNPFMSHLEGIIARGDRSVADLIEAAAKEGAMYDAWDEHIDTDRWRRAIEQCRFDVAPAIGARPTDRPLPWEFIDTGVSHAFLLREWDRYRAGIPTPDCRVDVCSDCGACPPGSRSTEARARRLSPPSVSLTPSPAAARSTASTHRYLLQYRKLGIARYLGALDLNRLWHRLLRIADVGLKYSSGFNPQPSIDCGWALPLGMESDCELVAFECAPIADMRRFTDQLSRLLPEGVSIASIGELYSREGLEQLANRASFMTALPQTVPFDPDALIDVTRKSGGKQLRAGDHILGCAGGPDGSQFTIALSHGGLRPVEAASFLAGAPVTAFDIRKTGICFKGGECFGA